MTGLELSRSFFRSAVAPILSREFPSFRYDAALIGPGSEVLGYDDDVSRDHHWGPRVMLFCSENEVEAVGPRVRDALAHGLPRTFAGYSTNFSEPDPADHGTQLLVNSQSGPVNHRVDVLSLDRWVAGYIGIRPPLDPVDWLIIPQQKLLTIVAGEVFHDGSGETGHGELVRLRQSLAWYPEDLWRYQLAAGWARIAQEEHLVGRAGATGDEVGARLIAARLVRDVMRLCFLMERRYAPYPKWFGRAFRELAVGRAIGPLLRQVLAATEWRARDRLLIPIYERIATAHNSLNITEAMPESVRQFFGRPFHVIAMHGFAEAILGTIDAAWLTPTMRRSPVGGIDQFTDNTDLLEDTAYCAGVRALVTGVVC